MSPFAPFPSHALRHRLLILATLFVLAGGPVRAQDYWIGASGDDWSVAGAWSTDNPPTSSDNCVNATANAIAFGPPDSYTINSFNITGGGSFTMTGGSLTVTTSLVSNGPVSLLGNAMLSVDSTLQVNNTLTIEGGTLANATLAPGTELSFGSFGLATLYNVNLNQSGSLNLAGENNGYNSVRLAGGTQLPSGSTVSLDHAGLLDFDNGETDTLNNVTINMSQDGTVNEVCLEAGETLVVGQGSKITGGGDDDIIGPLSGSGVAVLINNGLLQSSGGGGGLLIGFDAYSVPENVGSITTFTNNSTGLVEAVGAGSSVSINPLSVTNAGTLEALSGGSITVSPTTYVAGGTVESIGSGSGVASNITLGATNPWTVNGIYTANGGTITFGGAGPITLGSPSLTTSNGGAIVLATTLINTGLTFDPTVNVAGTHNFIVDNGTILNGSVTHAGSLLFAANANNILQNVNLDSGLNLSAGGWAHLMGGTQLPAGSTTTIDNGAILSFDNNEADTLTNATINFGGNGSNTTLAVEGGEELYVSLGSSINGPASGASYIGGYYWNNNNTSSTLDNSGTIASDQGGNLNVGLNPYNSVSLTNLINTNSGVLCAMGVNSALTVDPVIFTNYGTVEAINNGAVYIASYNLNNYGNIESLNSGSVTIQPGSAFVNQGTLTIGNGSTMTVTNGYTQMAGLTQANGVLNINSNALTLQGGTLAGSGSVQGNVSNAATVAPGSATTTATLTLTSNYTQTSAGNLFLKLAGNQAGQFDTLSVGGNITLGGMLTVDPINGVQLRQGEIFDILTYGGTRTGAFSSVMSEDSLVSFGVSYLDTSHEVELMVDSIETIPPPVGSGGGHSVSGFGNSGFVNTSFALHTGVVPGPESVVVMGLGLLGGLYRLRRRRQS